MPNYFNTYLKRQASKIEAMQKVVDNDNQYNVPGAIEMLLAQSVENAPNGLVTSELIKNIQDSWAKEADIIKQITPTPTIVNVRSLTTNYNQSSSSLATVAMVYLGFSLEVFPSQFQNYGGRDLNMVKQQEATERDFKAGITAMKKAIAELFISKLQATKTKVLNTPLAYNFEADTVIATAAQRRSVIGSLPLFMKGNNYPADLIHVLADMGTMQIIQDIGENGDNNAENQMKRLNGKQFFETNDMPVPVGKQASMFACPMGSVGFLTRVQPLAANEYETTDGWKFLTLPKNTMGAYGLPFEIEHRYRSVAGDVSTNTGNAKDTASVKEEHHFGMDVAIIVPHDADGAGAKTPVIEVHVNTAETDADTTAPLVSAVTSTALTSLVVDFDSAMALDAAGDTAIGEATETQLLNALNLTIATPGGTPSTITAVEASADSTQLTITIDSQGDLAATDYISSATLYDGAGNQFTANSGKLAQVNAGATAWEAMP